MHQPNDLMGERKGSSRAVANANRNGSTPPHSEESEKGVLSSIIQAKSIIPMVRSKIDRSDFNNPVHASIFTAVCECHEEAPDAFEFLSFTQYLRDHRLLDSVGGDGYVAELQNFVLSPTNVQYYIDTLLEKTARRAAIKKAEQDIANARDEASDFLPDIRTTEIVARPLMSFAYAMPDEAKTLLGERFVDVGSGALFVASSGIGKTTAAAQQDMLWSLGREAFGIKPARPLRSLTIQAENSDADLGEMARGVCAGLGLRKTDQTAIGDRVLYFSERARTGSDFLDKVVAPLLEKHRPDLLRMDPFLAYLGDDVNDQRATAAFLRSALNPLLEQFQCAAIVNHHTPKVTNRNTSEWRSSDWMYAGAGSADLTNWCRAALVIDPTYAAHVYRFIAAKRGGRTGWRDDDGERIYERYFCHDTSGGLYWREATAEDLTAVETSKPGRKGSSKTKEDFKALVPLVGAIPKVALFSKGQSSGIGGDKRLRGFLAELVEGGELHEWRVPRPKTNPQVWISRHEQSLV